MKHLSTKLRTIRMAGIFVAMLMMFGIVQTSAQSITISPWEMHYGSGVFNVPHIGSHGASIAYNYANIPASNHSGWQAAPLDGNGDIRFYATLDTIELFTQLDFTYFQTDVNLPTGTNLTTFNVSFAFVDDGARAYIFNSTYPNGSFVPGADMRGGNNVSANLASRAVIGEVNRIVIVQFDDCPTGNNLGGANVNVNGQVIPPDPCANDTENPTITCAANVSVVSGASVSGSATASIPNTGQSFYHNSTVNQTFNDPLPAGAVVTGIRAATTVYYRYSCCFSSLWVTVAGQSLGNVHVGSPAANKAATFNYTGAVSGYNYGGSNSFWMASYWNGVTFRGATLTISYEINGESCDAVVSVPGPTTADNCNIASVTNNFNGTSNASGTYPVGTTNVVWTVTDSSGNSATCTQTVTVTDNTAPQVSCPADVSVNSPTTVIDSASVNVASGGSICCWQTMTKTFADPIPAGGTVIGAAVTFRARDQGWGGTGAHAHVYIHGVHIGGRRIYHGSTTGTVSNMVDIPNYNYGGNVTMTLTHVGWPGWRLNWEGGTVKMYYKTADGCVQYVTIGAPTATDSCGIASMTNDFNNTSDASDYYPVGSTDVEWTITDNNGNSSTCTQNVTVTDVTAPVIAGCPSDIAITATPNNCSPAVTWTAPTADDNCEVSTITSTHTSGDNFNVGTTTVTYTFSDPSGNSSSCSFDVVITAQTLVASTTSPTFNGGWNISCNGASDGSATASTTGGCEAYSYSWSNGGSTATITGLTAGTYTVTSTDDKGTTATSSITLTEPTVLANTLTAATYNGGWNISCNGASDGSISNSVSGGTTAYSYSWSNGATTKDVSGLAAGTYSVTVTDANNCTSTASTTLTEPDVLTATLSMSVYNCGTNVSCNGASDGSGMVATSSGGTTPYNYSWSDGQTTKDATSLSAGTYTLTITDDNGCTWSGSVTLTEPTLVTGSTSSPTYNCGYNVSCNGFNDGSATMVNAGGCAPYTYSWSNGQTTATATSLAAGVHTATATDANGCTYTESITLTEPDPLTISMSPTDTIIDCIPRDFAITATPAGGCAPYQYLWTTGSSTDTIMINPDVSTVYNVVVTDDNGCVSDSAQGGSTSVTVINRCGNNDRKSLICHVPSGNKQNPQTICISRNALNPHLGSLGDLHGGDYCGPCTNKALTEFADGATGADPASVYVNAYPNPFTNVTTIEFSIASSSDVKIEVFSLTGSQVAILFDGYMEGGSINAVEFTAGNLPNGVYIYKLTTETSTTFDKVTLVK